jgi:mitogen-activated protein kinase 1/3
MSNLKPGENRTPFNMYSITSFSYSQ